MKMENKIPPKNTIEKSLNALILVILLLSLGLVGSLVYESNIHPDNKITGKVTGLERVSGFAQHEQPVTAQTSTPVKISSHPIGYILGINPDRYTSQEAYNNAVLETAKQYTKQNPFVVESGKYAGEYYFIGDNFNDLRLWKKETLFGYDLLAPDKSIPITLHYDIFKSIYPSPPPTPTPPQPFKIGDNVVLKDDTTVYKVGDIIWDPTQEKWLTLIYDPNKVEDPSVIKAYEEAKIRYGENVKKVELSQVSKVTPSPTEAIQLSSKQLEIMDKDIEDINIDFEELKVLMEEVQRKATTQQEKEQIQLILEQQAKVDKDIAESSAKLQEFRKELEEAKSAEAQADFEALNRLARAFDQNSEELAIDLEELNKRLIEAQKVTTTPEVSEAIKSSSELASGIDKEMGDISINKQAIDKLLTETREVTQPTWLISESVARRVTYDYGYGFTQPDIGHMVEIPLDEFKVGATLDPAKFRELPEPIKIEKDGIFTGVETGKRYYIERAVKKLPLGDFVGVEPTQYKTQKEYENAILAKLPQGYFKVGEDEYYVDSLMLYKKQTTLFGCDICWPDKLIQPEEAKSIFKEVGIIKPLPQPLVAPPIEGEITEFTSPFGTVQIDEEENVISIDDEEVKIIDTTYTSPGPSGGKFEVGDIVQSDGEYYLIKRNSRQIIPVSNYGGIYFWEDPTDERYYASNGIPLTSFDSKTRKWQLSPHDSRVESALYVEGLQDPEVVLASCPPIARCVAPEPLNPKIVSPPRAPVREETPPPISERKIDSQYINPPDATQNKIIEVNGKRIELRPGQAYDPVTGVVLSVSARPSTTTKGQRIKYGVVRSDNVPVYVYEVNKETGLQTINIGGIKYDVHPDSLKGALLDKWDGRSIENIPVPGGTRKIETDRQSGTQKWTDTLKTKDAITTKTEVTQKISDGKGGYITKITKNEKLNLESSKHERTDITILADGKTKIEVKYKPGSDKREDATVTINVDDRTSQFSGKSLGNLLRENTNLQQDENRLNQILVEAARADVNLEKVGEGFIGEPKGIHITFTEESILTMDNDIVKRQLSRDGTETTFSGKVTFQDGNFYYEAGSSSETIKRDSQGKVESAEFQAWSSDGSTKTVTSRNKDGSTVIEVYKWDSVSEDYTDKVSELNLGSRVSDSASPVDGLYEFKKDGKEFYYDESVFGYTIKDKTGKDVTSEFKDEEKVALGLSINKIREKIDNLPYTIAQEKSQRFFANVERVLTEFRGLGYYATLFFDEDSLLAWRDTVDRTFATLYLGTEYWSSAICSTYIDGEDEGIAYAETPQGLAQIGAHIEATRTEQIFTDKGREFIYKITFAIRNGDYAKDPRAPEEMNFNVVLKGERTVNVFTQEQKVKRGSTFSRVGRNAIVQDSPTLFTQICIRFDEIPLRWKLDNKELCNSIVEAAGEAEPLTTTTPTTAPSAGTAPESEINDF